MAYLYIGKLVNTHGLKGEVRIITELKEKDFIYKIGTNLYIGEKKDKHTINSYRVHKNYDMVTFKDIDNIDDVLKYKGCLVYINKDEFKDIFFETDLIGFEVYTDIYIGKITEIINSYQDLLVVKNKDKRYLLPYVKELMNNIDVQNKKIEYKNIKGLFDEN